MNLVRPVNWAAPGAIGVTTPNSGIFSALLLSPTVPTVKALQITLPVAISATNPNIFDVVNTTGGSVVAIDGNGMLMFPNTQYGYGQIRGGDNGLGIHWKTQDFFFRIGAGTDLKAQLQINGVSGGGATDNATLLVAANGTARTGFILRAIAAMSANLQEWQNSSNALIAAISAVGKLLIYGGAIVLSGGKFTTLGDAQTSTLIARCTTSNATPTELFLDGATASQRIQLSSNGSSNISFTYSISINAHSVADRSRQAAFFRRGKIYKQVAAASIALLAGEIQENLVGLLGWSFAVSADSTNSALKLTATGGTLESIQWVARVEIVEVYG